MTPSTFPLSSSGVDATMASASAAPIVGTATKVTNDAANIPLLEYPIVIIHGFGDIPHLSDTMQVTEPILSGMGIEYFTPQLPPFGSIYERSKSLIEQIVARYPGKTVHFFAHSMGGLNARDIASTSMKTELGFKVKTVTTFGSPHRGIKAIDIIPGLNGSSPVAGGTRRLLGSDFEGLGNLTHDFMAKFNTETMNNPDVKYFSWAGEINFPSLLFAITFPFSRPYGPTDGLINVDSASWGPDLGPGVHLGTCVGLDHLSIVGRTTILGSIPYLKAAEKGEMAIVLPINSNLVKPAIELKGMGTFDSHMRQMGEISHKLGVPAKMHLPRLSKL